METPTSASAQMLPSGKLTLSTPTLESRTGANNAHQRPIGGSASCCCCCSVSMTFLVQIKATLGFRCRAWELRLEESWVDVAVFCKLGPGSVLWVSLEREHCCLRSTSGPLMFGNAQNYALMPSRPHAASSGTAARSESHREAW